MKQFKYNKFLILLIVELINLLIILEIVSE